MPTDLRSTPSRSPESAAEGPTVGRRFRSSLLNGITGLGVSTVSYLALSRTLAPDEYGRAAIVMAVWGMLLNTIDWCGELLMRFGPVELKQSGSLHVTIATRLLFAWPPLIVLSLGAPLYLAHAQHWALPLLAMTVAWLVISTAHNVLSWSAIAAQRFPPLTVANALLKGAPLIALCLTMLLHLSLSAEGLLLSMLLGTLAAATVLKLRLGRQVRLARPSRALFAQMWRYSLPALLGMPALAAISWLDPLLLDHWGARADVGRYQLAHPTFTVFSMLGASLNAVLAPELVRARAQEDPHAFSRYRDRLQPTLARLLALSGFGAACLAAPLVRAVLPPSYALTGELVALLSVAGGFLLALWTMHPLVTSTDSVACLQLAYLAQAIANVGLDVLLAARFGAVGVAIANCVAWAVAFSALSLLLRRKIGAHAASVAPLVLLGAGVVALLVLPVPESVRFLAGAILLLCAAGGALSAWRQLRVKTAA